MLHDASMPRKLPAGTVTFLFTDIEGSTRLLADLGVDAYAAALVEHRRTLREVFTRHHGVEFGTEGDSFCVAFTTASAAVQAAVEVRQALVNGPMRVRIGIHTGTPHIADDDYVGEDVHLAARIAAAGHGGQVLLSKPARELVAVETLPLGEHHLKDFSASVAIFQLGSERFPPLRTISTTNLPHPASSFVGREREVSEVATLVADGIRLLTLTGPGGTGKTRLAIESAARVVADFPDGVHWVSLAALKDPALVTGSIAQTLGAKNGLAGHIGERKLLVVVDNLEQVVSAAPELAAVVEACPNLQMLITSRELLRIRGETEYPVLPLARSEAVALFYTRAGIEADETVDRLCQALENLPLAVELAAARSSVLTPSQMLERLSQRLDLLKGGRDADPRQHTLRATLEWSYELLTSEEKELFARLAVFRGGCTLEVAEQVVDADLDVLQSLIDKSLMRRTGERFWMLETIREFATEQLAISGESDDYRIRHADRFLAMAEEAYPHLTGDPREWTDRLQAEHDNLRAALDRLQSSGHTRLALQLAGALWKYWYIRGHHSEGRERLKSVLAADTEPTQVRGRALNGATGLESEGGDPAMARALAAEALDLHKRLGDAWGIANSLFLLGNLAEDDVDWTTARDLLEDSLVRFEELGDEHYVLLLNSHLAWVHGELGDHDRERSLTAETLARARATGNRRIEVSELATLSAFALDDKRFGDAYSLLAAALAIRCDLGERLEIADILGRMAEVRAFEGHGGTAAVLLAAAEAVRQQTGGDRRWMRERAERTVTAIRSQIDETAFDDAWEKGRRLSMDEAIDLAYRS
jgi:predicted ATPase/class 3 adenylate cyclase